MTRRLLAACLLALLATPVMAQPREPQAVFVAPLDDPREEARARAIGAALACVVCEGQSVEASAAPLAADMRKVIRERIEAGDTDEEIFAFMVERYGERALLRPPMAGPALALWLAPVVILAAGLTLAFWRLRAIARRAGPS